MRGRAVGQCGMMAVLAYRQLSKPLHARVCLHVDEDPVDPGVDVYRLEL